MQIAVRKVLTGVNPHTRCRSKTGGRFSYTRLAANSGLRAVKGVEMPTPD